ncbi:hypothetical protein LCGC14_2194240 [marine sediment metagenome]|uniref:Uncharacterized protein n=1 Tax=marine sediment metagenome TaxID=412755 RepID=A0A0F9FW12_9ZZZZ
MSSRKEEWKFENHYWRGPLWPIKAVFYTATGVVIVGMLAVIIGLVVALVLA